MPVKHKSVLEKSDFFSGSKTVAVAETLHIFARPEPEGISLFCISCFSIPNLAFSSRHHLAWKLTEQDARSLFSKAGHRVPVPPFGIGRHRSALFMSWPKNRKESVLRRF